MPGTPSISVIIPVYNAPDRVLELIRSILRSSDCRDILEVIIGDDDLDFRTNRLLDELAGEQALLKVIHRSKNVGFLRNVNDLYDKAKSDIVLLLNSDTLVPDGFVTRIVTCFHSDESLSH